MEVRIINNRSQWNTFLSEHPRSSSAQLFESGEYLNTLGHIVFRLGAFVEERLVGIMLLAGADVSVSSPLTLLGLKWMYCAQGPLVLPEYSLALNALLYEAHAIASREHAIFLRLTPEYSEDDAFHAHLRCASRIGNVDSYASEWAKAQGNIRFELHIEFTATPLHAQHAVAHPLHTGTESELSHTPVYEYVYRPFLYKLWKLFAHGSLPIQAPALQQVTRQLACSETAPLQAV